MAELTEEQLDELFELFRRAEKAFGRGNFPIDNGGNRQRLVEGYLSMTDVANMMGMQNQIDDTFLDVPDEDADRLVGELNRRYEQSETAISEKLAGAHYYYPYLDRMVRRKAIADKIRDAYKRAHGDVDDAFELLGREDQRGLRRFRDLDDQSRNNRLPSRDRTYANRENVRDGRRRTLTQSGKLTSFGEDQRVTRTLPGRVPYFEWSAKIRSK